MFWCHSFTMRFWSSFWKRFISLLDTDVVKSPGTPSRVQHCHPAGEAWYLLRKWPLILWWIITYLLCNLALFRLLSVTHSGTAAAAWTGCYRHTQSFKSVQFISVSLVSAEMALILLLRSFYWSTGWCVTTSYHVVHMAECQWWKVL